MRTDEETMPDIGDDPHAGQPVMRRGPALLDARAVVILVHGRGATATDILTLADAFDLSDIAYLAPQAAGNAWYPFSFRAPVERNQPGLDSGLRVLARLLAEIGNEGVPAARVGLLGFSQGACLALEFTARHPQRFATVAGFSGGLIGPAIDPRAYNGSLDHTPVFLGCSDVDAHIPVDRVHESAGVFRALGAIVDARIYPGMGHSINRDEIAAVHALLAAVR
jgi:predicted esterase